MWRQMSARDAIRRVSTWFVAVVVLVGGAAPIAGADTGVLPNSPDLPWTDPAHQSPLEVLAAQIAGHIAGRAVTVECDGQTDWNARASQYQFDPLVELGFVPFQYYISSRTVVADANHVFVSPTACWNLDQFGMATVKPTKCQSVVTQTTTKLLPQRYRVTVRVKVKGRWLKRTVWRVRFVRKTSTQTTTGSTGPCYLGNEQTATSEPMSYWQSYSQYAQGILTLAHESVHLTQDRAGVSIDAALPTSETNANCYGLQWMPYVAEQLGASPDDAEAIAEFAYDYLYPGYQGISHNGSPYWSADCRPNGPLDLTPGDNVWP